MVLYSAGGIVELREEDRYRMDQWSQGRKRVALEFHHGIRMRKINSKFKLVFKKEKQGEDATPLL
jgi:hypothetical protein